MKTISSIIDMQHRAEQIRKSGETIAFVPTMGYLHKGHLSL
ncbi:MAG: pantoate--beta-alanine ligase, partial [Thermodesulfobacteriota bacterium]